ACIVDAEWVTPEQVAAAEVWIDYIREDEQQRAFMAAGFRPGTDISLRDPASKITARFGLNPDPPAVVLNPSLTKPEVAAAIDAAWIQVKRPGIVNFVVDTSGSMDGEKLKQAKDGLIKALDSMASNNQVGFLSFHDKVTAGVPIAPLSENRFQIATAVDNLRAGGQTALYEAIKVAVEAVDRAEGDPDAIRGVVVLTDGQANKGNIRLDNIVSMSSRSETRITEFPGFVSDTHGRDDQGRLISKNDIIGVELALNTKHEIQIFFIGIGDDADIQVGRILAGATSAEFQGIAEDDLASLLEEFSKYF
ncbi:MAG: VWA domain-containing protein, partial [Dehalococcoidia bacterium]